MEQVISVLTSLTPLVAMLVGTGLVYKYVPFLAKLPDMLIPLLNALIAFLTAFGPAPAEAGILGVAVAKLGLGAKIVGSLMISALASGLYEVYVRHPLEKVGIQKPLGSR